MSAWQPINGRKQRRRQRARPGKCFAALAHGALLWLLVAAGFRTGAAPAAAGLIKTGTNKPVEFSKEIRPLLSQYCFGCHGEKKKGGLDFRVYEDERSALRDRRVFESVLSKLQAHEMPPENKPQPTEMERTLITNWINQGFFQCDCRHPDPGRVTIHRLNRVEYNNTIRDLLGVNFQPADDFPADDSGYGFDNIGDVLSVSPLLMHKYLAAAEKIVESLFVSAGSAAAAARSNTQLWQRLSGQGSIQGSPRERASRIIAGFGRRAFRRPLTRAESERLLALYKTGESGGNGFDESLKLVLEAILVSPQFLYRGVSGWETSQRPGIQPIDEYALASRLSYFLWSSTPDEELLGLAGRRKLRRNLEVQVRRMLNDPKAHALVENFAGQWLQLRNLKLLTLDPVQFPDFSEELRAAMQQETELLFQSILKENRSVLEFINADYTFLNERLARLYKIDGVQGDAFRRVALHDRRRGGILMQASILTLTSNPTRTSPVKRGKWVLENILGAPPPPPPPNVPDLKEDKAASGGSLRQRMEQHRADPNCASCHARMDPIGFAFENYNAIGAWRDRDADFDIDPSGKLVSGETFDGPTGLKELLLHQKKDQFVRCLVQKLLVYALGRGLEFYDRCAVEQITGNLVKDQYRFGTLIVEIVKSVPFQMQHIEPGQSTESRPNQTAAANSGNALKSGQIQR